MVGRFLESTDDAYVQADSTIVAPKVSGYLSEVLVEDNQPVKAAQPLAKIDDRDYVASLDQAKADVATAQADIENVTAALEQQQAVIAQARATVAVDQANLTYAEQENTRYGALAKSRVRQRGDSSAGGVAARHRARHANSRYGSGYGRRAAGRRAAGAARQDQGDFAAL